MKIIFYSIILSFCLNIQAEDIVYKPVEELSKAGVSFESLLYKSPTCRFTKDKLILEEIQSYNLFIRDVTCDKNKTYRFIPAKLKMLNDSTLGIDKDVNDGVFYHRFVKKCIKVSYNQNDRHQVFDRVEVVKCPAYVALKLSEKYNNYKTFEEFNTALKICLKRFDESCLNEMVYLDTEVPRTDPSFYPPIISRQFVNESFLLKKDFVDNYLIASKKETDRLRKKKYKVKKGFPVMFEIGKVEYWVIVTYHFIKEIGEKRWLITEISGGPVTH